MARDKYGVLHIAWTCFACLFVNCWNWEEEGVVLDIGPTEMHCDNCDRITKMEVINVSE